MEYFTTFYLDNEKDIVMDLYMEDGHLYYVLGTPNHKTGNLISNLAKLCELPLSFNEAGLKIIQGEIPCYINAYNERMYIFRMGNTKVANIYPDGRVEMKANIPSISKTLMSQTKDYQLDISKTIIKSYILEECKFTTDLHTHMNGNLSGDDLIALGIYHQIRYPFYYIRKLGLKLSEEQEEKLMVRYAQSEEKYASSSLEGKYLKRKIEDHTFINFADLILNNIEHAAENIVKIRASLSILKDGQAVFTNLEKVYLYRYVFCKGKSAADRIPLRHIDALPDADIQRTLQQIIADHESERYGSNTLLQDKLLWIGRTYQKQGVCYAEISNTSLVKESDAFSFLKEVHEILPKVKEETGVSLRFLAAMRRIPLTIVKEDETPQHYFEENIEVLKAVAADPYVAGCDFVGEEINSILELKQVIREVVKIAASDPSFVIRIHAGENDSLKNNVSDSIRCVRESLAEGQKMPRMRIGHGLYTSNLTSSKGQKLIQDLKENGTVLEFQITSNVRLNNLNSLEDHPLKQYLSYGICCVQGSDGAALYGTNSIDEQLSLEKLLDLSREDQLKMKATENALLQESKAAFIRKSEALKEALKETDFDTFYRKRLEEAKKEKIRIRSLSRFDSTRELKNQIRELPWDKDPIIVAGGSFNTERRVSKVYEEEREIIDCLMEKYDPSEVFFVIGHKLSGYEKYLLEHNDKGFEIYAFVPSVITRKERDLLSQSNVFIRVSTEMKGAGLYKSINYEIFERRSSSLYVFDGNSAALNLIQEARNGKGKAAIYVNRNRRLIREKAEYLQGYVTLFSTREDLGL